MSSPKGARAARSEGGHRPGACATMMAHILGIVGRSMVIALALILAACAPAQTHLSGTELDRSAAPDFTLTDGLSGGTVTLSSLRGNVVAMAFLYTHCPDVCPLTAGLFRAAQK